MWSAAADHCDMIRALSQSGILADSGCDDSQIEQPRVIRFPVCKTIQVKEVQLAPVELNSQKQSAV